jgi:phospholipase/lecithinase/hemolysin
LQKLPLLAALLCSLVSAQAAKPAAASPPPAQHPLTGSWTWTLPGKQCTETWHYRANGTRTGSSGEETTQSRYEVSAMPSLLGFYRLTKTVTEGNGKKDCSGDLHEAPGEPAIRFIQFSPRRDQLIVCKEESLKACFGPLKRVAQ